MSKPDPQTTIKGFYDLPSADQTLAINGGIFVGGLILYAAIAFVVWTQKHHETASRLAGTDRLMPGIMYQPPPAEKGGFLPGSPHTEVDFR